MGNQKIKKNTTSREYAKCLGCIGINRFILHFIEMMKLAKQLRNGIQIRNKKMNLQND
jgi:hypothetical protein